MIDYLKYLSEDERRQYEEARAAIIESTDKEEQAQGLLSDLFINHFRNVSYNPLEELQAAAREDIRQYTKADYDRLFVKNEKTGEAFFRSKTEWFLLFIDNKAIFNSVTSQTKQGFIDFLTVMINGAPEAAYNAWAEDHNKEAAPFNALQIISEWAEAQYKDFIFTGDRVIAKRADIIEYPLDKVNNTVWDAMKEDTGGQIAIKAEKQGSGKQINIYYSIDFGELEDYTDLRITKNLTSFDKRVYVAVGALFNAGNRIITLTQIHYAMGNDKRPNKTQLEKIYKSVYKMQTARIFLNNQEEAAAYNYQKVIYNDYLLPLKSKIAIVNGQLSEAALALYEEPPLITFAKQRNQVTTIPIKLLNSPISKTDTNLSIEDYLLERIARIKANPCRILLTTLYEKAGITTRNQKARTPEKLRAYLDHYKQEKFIKSYTLDKEAITIIV